MGKSGFWFWAGTAFYVGFVQTLSAHYRADLIGHWKKLDTPNFRHTKLNQPEFSGLAICVQLIFNGTY